MGEKLVLISVVVLQWNTSVVRKVNATRRVLRHALHANSFLDQLMDNGVTLSQLEGSLEEGY